MQKIKDIKLKDNSKKDIKVKDRAIIGTQKLKNKLLEAKKQTEEITTNNENVPTDYAINKVTTAMKKSPYSAKKYGKNMTETGIKNVYKSRDNIYSANKEMDFLKKKNRAKKVARKMVQNSKQYSQTTNKTIKVGDKNIKTGNEKVRNIKIRKNTVQSTENEIQGKISNSVKTVQSVKNFAQKTAKRVKSTAKTIVSAVKAIIGGAKALIAALVAGGSIVIVIILVICLIGMLLGSVFGIFFSNEKTSNRKDEISMGSVIADINTEFMEKITDIQKKENYYEYDIDSSRAEWKDVLAVYATKVSNGKDESNVVTLDDNKVKILKEVFWDMNEISSSTEKVSKEVTTVDDGNKTTEDKEVTILHIKIKGKTAEQMIEEYNFSDSQKSQIEEILSAEYAKMWSQVIYGSSIGSTDIVEVARSQIGNVGGQPYWSWYGYKSRVSWCATFVSWCANECGYIEAGIIPKFAACQLEGVSWFKSCGLWKDGGYIPKSGDIIFFDWKDKHDGFSDHVGIVDRVENGRVYTIEGNSIGDMCRQNNYDIYSEEIQGYGTPMY